MIKIAELSCGAEYSGVESEIEKAAEMTGGKIFHPDVDIDSLREIEEEFGYSPKSPGLKLLMARAKAVVDHKYEVDGVFVATCFRCAEGALVRNEVRKYIQENTNLPIFVYSFTERTKFGQLLTRMESLYTIVEKKELLMRKRQEGTTVGIDSGSTTTKAVLMRDNKIISKSWIPTTDVCFSAEKAYSEVLNKANLERKNVEKIGVTGYGRFLVGKKLNMDLIQEELTVGSKGAVWLANRLEGEAMIIDIGGMDNKAITVRDGIPDNFTMGGICAGASGRFLEIAAKRLGIKIEELGKYALRGIHGNVMMNSYCSIFGIQDLVLALADGKSVDDVAAAACYSVAEQVYEQQLQEIEIRMPIIQVGGTSLIEGLVKAVGDLVGEKTIVPKDSQYAGAVGAALLVSGI
nr:YjiL-like protein [uncultured archaeon]